MAYEPHEWITGETITAALLNAMEQGIVNATDEITSVVVNTLDADASATASLEDGVLTLGIPRGATGADGAKGDAGADGTTIDTVDVSVDNNTGVPAASGSISGTTLSLSFQNLKGDTGEQGPAGDAGAAGEPGADGEDGVGVASITLTKGEDGTIESGTWEDTDGESHTITIS